MALSDRSAARPSDVAELPWLPARRVATDARHAVDAGSRNRVGEGLSRHAAHADGKAIAVWNRGSGRAALRDVPANDVVVAGRERDQARPQSAAGGWTHRDSRRANRRRVGIDRGG